MTDAEMIAEVNRRIKLHREQMNNPKNEPALRYMAAGAFEAFRDFRSALGEK